MKFLLLLVFVALAVVHCSWAAISDLTQISYGTTTMSIGLQWTAFTSGTTTASYYKVCENSNCKCIDVGSVQENSTVAFSFAGSSPGTLSANNNYNVTVTAHKNNICNNVYSGSVSPAYSAYTAPSDPIPLLLSSQSNTSLSFSWTASSGSANVKYDVCCKLSCITTTVSATTLSNLLLDTPYNCTIVAYNFGARTIIFGPYNFSTILPPSSLRQSGATNTTVSLQWAEVSGPNYPYNYLICQDMQCYNTPTNSFTFRVNIYNTAYTFTVSSVVGEIKSATSTITAFSGPIAVSDINIVSRTSNSITLSYTPVPGGALSVIYERCCDEVCSNSTSVITGLVAGTTYSCRIKSITLVGVATSNLLLVKTLPSAPVNFQQIDATSNSVMFSWQVVPSITDPYRYKICWNTFCSTTQATNYTYNSLPTPNTGYVFSVSTLDTGSPVLESSATSFTAYTSPLAVTNIFVSTRTIRSLQLSWTAPTGPTSPTVNYAACCGFSNCASLTSSTFSIFNNLQVNSIYNCTVSTSTSYAKGPISSVFYFSTTPTNITGFYASSVTHRQFDLSWDVLNGSSGPYVYKICKFNTTNSFDCVNASVSPFPYNINVLPNTQYSMQIQAIDRLGQTSAISVIVLTSGPAAVYDFSALSRSTSSITFNWSPPSIGFYNYTVCCKGAFPVQFCNSTSITTATLAGLTPSSVYNCSIESKNYGSIMSQYQLFSTLPSSVTVLTLQNVTDAAITLSWNAIVAGNPSSGPYIYKVCTSIGTNCISSQNPSVVYNLGVIANKNYTLCVNVIDSYGQSSSSLCQQYETLASVTTNFIAPENRKTFNSIYLQWNSVAASSYEIVINNARSLFTSSSNLIVTNINASEWYSFEIYSLNSRGARSLSKVTVTQATLPPPISNLTITSSTHSSIIFDWKYPKYFSIPITKYLLCYQLSCVESLDVGFEWTYTTSFKENVLYTVSVVAENAIDNYSIPIYVNFITPRSAPNITNMITNSDNLIVVWRPVVKKYEHTLHYRVSVMQDDIEIASEIVPETSSKSQNITIPKLKSLVNYEVQIRTISTYNGVQMNSAAATIKSFTLPLSNDAIAAIGTTASLVGAIVLIALFIAILIFIIVLAVVIYIIIKKRFTKVKANSATSTEGIELIPMLSNNPNTAELMIDSRQIKVLNVNNTTSVMVGNFLGMDTSIKIISKSNIGIQSMPPYYFELKKLHSIPFHPNIARVFGAFESPDTSSIGLVSEYCHNGTIFEIISTIRLDFNIKLGLIKGITSGMEVLHNNQLAHMNLHVATVFVDEEYVAKIVDYGFANKSVVMNQTDPLLSASYCSPELLKQLVKNPNQRNSISFYQKSDIYSFGVLIYAIYFQNRTPFGSNYSNNRQIIDLLCHYSDTRPQFNETVVPQREKFVTDLMKQCWTTDPSKRPSFSQIVAKLNQQ